MSTSTLPRTWATGTLGSIADWSSGGTPSKARPEYWNGSLPWVSPKDMKVFNLSDTQEHISERAVAAGVRIAPSSTTFIVVRGMILAHTFPVCVAQRAMSFNQDVKAIVPKKATDGRFLAHWLNGHSGALLRLVTEATHGTKRIDLADLLKYPIALPPLNEQRRVADVLDTLDQTISKTEQLVAKLKQMKQGLLHDLLTRGIDENGELRDSERHPEQFHDSRIGRIPNAWEVSSVEVEFDNASGLTLGPHRQPRRHPWPYLRVANVFRGMLDLADVAQMEVSSNELAGHQLMPGDLLVVEGHANPAEIGRCAMATSAVAGFVFQNHLFRLRSKRMVPRFGLLWMNSPWAQRYWRNECATSSGLNTINSTKLKRLLVLVPPQVEQEHIVRGVEDLELRLLAEERALAKLRLLKQGLMEDLLTGHVRITPLLSEPTP